jgi:hypothetical protein
METIAIVKPGDKATIYLNPYFLNFSREKPWDKDEGDFQKVCGSAHKRK